jgi:hypothetical protein
MTEAVGEVESGAVRNATLEDEWRDLTYYVSRIMDMVSTNTAPTSGDINIPLVKQMLNAGPWSLAVLANYTQLAEAVGIIMTRMTNMSSHDLEM